jgi:CelD/BcsL family acetyltransferase involved in cellulose biosynthesis
MTSASGGFTATRFDTWRVVPAEWSSARHTPFQSTAFLAAWYETLGSRPAIRPVIVEVRRDGAPSLLLPLVYEVNGLRTLRFADADVADNNAPLLGAAAPQTPEAFHAAWLEALRVMPAADIISIGKQPDTIGGAPNPLRWLGRPQPSPLQSHPLNLGGTFEEYSRSRTKKFRKEQERVWRVFTRAPGATFALVTEPAGALAILSDMDRLQAARMAEVGAAYQLGEPIYASFYRAVVGRGVESGAVVLGALTAGDETVGALLGVSNGEEVAFVRLAHAGGEWANCSPGRLVIERTLMALHERGIRRFDFSIGDQHYKEPFGVGTGPLSDVDVPLTWRAWPAIAANRARAQLRQFRTLRAMYGRVRRQSAA